MPVPLPAVPAHAFHDTDALGLPLVVVLYGTAALLVVGAVALGRVARPPLAAHAGRRLPAVVVGALRVARPFFAALGLVVFAVVVAAGFWGPGGDQPNLAPLVSLVVVPVVVVVGSAVVGPWWPQVSPFATLAWLGERLVPSRAGTAPVSDYTGEPDQVGQPGLDRPGAWAGPVLLGAILWLRHAYHAAGSGRVVAGLVVGYTVVVLVGARRWGRPWLAYGEGLAAAGRVAATLAPLARDQVGQLVLRPPLSGLASARLGRAELAVAVVAVGAGAFDALTFTPLWADLAGDRVGWGSTAVRTAGLAWVVGTVAVVFVAAARWAERLGRPPGVQTDGRIPAFAPVLVPLMVGLLLATQGAVAVFSGRLAAVLASDPFDRGWDLFGTAADTVNVGLLSSPGVLYAQVAAVLAGGLVAVVTAHDRALALLGAAAMRARTPVVTTAVVFTVGALALVLGG